MLRFYSNAEDITVRYGIKGGASMWHMPSTGVSGVDLYAISADGDWRWCRGKRTSSDTITYQFSGLTANDRYHNKGREYRLYLPLYAQTTWLEIGVPEGMYFEPIPQRQDKPIVVYGTSIAQGGCASRSGNGWVGMLGRRMDHPMINLAFSGNGRMEEELIDLISEIDAKIYILDCLPNLTSRELFTAEEVKQRILKSVRTLKERHPNTPILLTEHAGYSNSAIQAASGESYRETNMIQQEAFAQLKQEGMKGIYLLGNAVIDLSLDGTVDGVHPNDIGMLDYAIAYERMLRIILKEPVGDISTTQPVIQRRDRAVYEWEKRHQQKIKDVRTGNYENVIMANSIVHFWGDQPDGPLTTGERSWEKYLRPHKVANLGYGWDRIENVLWRVYHGELDGYSSRGILVMIGTNNFFENTNEEILMGLDFLVRAIRVRQPSAEITLAGILPRRDGEDRVKTINKGIEQLTYNQAGVAYVDFGDHFLDAEGKLKESLFADGLHPNAKGYELLGVEIEKIFE
jgi:lysophospholipase L1-like esterase